MTYTLVCLACSKTFITKTNTRQYCSITCKYADQRKISDKVCEACGKIFRPWTNKQRFCSRECFGGRNRNELRTWSEEQQAKMIELYIAGQSGGQIAKIVGFTKRVVYLALNAAKIELRERTYVYHKPTNKRDFTDEEIEQIKFYYEFGLSSHHIAELMGVKGSRPILQVLGDRGLTRNKGKSYAKAWRTIDGHIVKSSGELVVDNWLYNHGIAHIYEPRLEVDPHYRADFFAGGYYIELWGGGPNMSSYRRSMTKKFALYAAHNLPLISITWKQTLKDLDLLLSPLLNSLPQILA